MEDWRVAWSDFLNEIRAFEDQIRNLPICVKKIFTNEEEEVQWRVPKIVMIGGVGVGKTSVLERIIGSEDLKLSKGAGGITRQVTKLVSTTPTSLDAKCESEGEDVIRSSELIPKELEFIDLPGFHRIPMSGQDENIEKLTLNQIKMYTAAKGTILEEGNLLLLILPADCEIVNSDILQLVREEIDPSGQRTIICLTKLDLLEKAEDSVSQLNYTISQVFNSRAVIAVKNAGQLHLNEKLDNLEREESDFFSSINLCEQYKTGIESLRREIVSTLKERGDHFKKNLISKLKCYKNRLEVIINTAVDPNLNLNLITKYIDNVTNQIEGGGHQMIFMNELTTGSKIKIFLNESFPEAINSIDPTAGLDLKELEIILKNSQGLMGNNSLYNQEKCLKILTKKQIQDNYKGLIDEAFQMVFEEVEKLIIIPGVRIEMADCDATAAAASVTEDEFYDVATSETDEDEGYDHTEFDDLFEGEFKSIILSYSKSLSESINSVVYKVLQKQGTRTRNLLNDFVEMESENNFYHRDDEEVWQLYKEYNFSTIRRNRSQSQSQSQSKYQMQALSQSLSLTNINDSNCSISSSSLGLLQEDAEAEAEEDNESIKMNPISKNSFFKEFRALLFQPNPYKNKRIEYRPKRPQLPPTLHQTQDQSTNTIHEYRTQVLIQQQDVPHGCKEEITLLISILRIYLINFKRRLLDFVPKALMHFLIRETVKEVSMAVLPLGRDSGSSHTMMRERAKVKGMKNVIDRISKLIE